MRPQRPRGGSAVPAGTTRLSGLCAELAGKITAPDGNPGAAGSSLTVSELEQALASPAVAGVLAGPAFAPLTSLTGGAANVPDYCAILLGLPQLPVPALLPSLPAAALAQVPTAVLGRLSVPVLSELPRSVLATLPPSVLAKLPSSVLVTLPSSALAKLPSSVLAKLPPSVLSELPTSVLSGLPPSILSRLPSAVQSSLPAPLRSELGLG